MIQKTMIIFKADESVEVFPRAKNNVINELAKKHIGEYATRTLPNGIKMWYDPHGKEVNYLATTALRACGVEEELRGASIFAER